MSLLRRLRDLLRSSTPIDVSITCDSTGITLLQSNATTHHIPWQQLTNLIAYKKDCVTTDQVRLILSTATFASEVTEDDPGFDVLVAAIREYLPASLPNWRGQLIASPAGDPTITHVFPPAPQQ